MFPDNYNRHMGITGNLSVQAILNQSYIKHTYEYMYHIRLCSQSKYFIHQLAYKYSTFRIKRARMGTIYTYIYTNMQHNEILQTMF